MGCEMLCCGETTVKGGDDEKKEMMLGNYSSADGHAHTIAIMP